MIVDPAWGVFFHQPFSSLYVKDRNNWKHYTPNTQLFTRLNPQYALADYSEPPTQCTHIAMAWHHEGHLVHHGIGHHEIPTPDSQSDWTIEWSNTIDNQLTQDIQAAINKGTAIALTDRSFKDSKGTAGYYIGADFHSLMQGACRVPGQPKDHSSFRSKIGRYLCYFVSSTAAV